MEEEYNPFWNNSHDSLLDAFGCWYSRYDYFLREFGEDYYETKLAKEMEDYAREELLRRILRKN